MISDPWIDRSRIRLTGYKTPYYYRKQQAQRRDRLRAAGKCICGPEVGTVSNRGTEHGEPVKGGRCARCLLAYQESK